MVLPKAMRGLSPLLTLVVLIPLLFQTPLVAGVVDGYVRTAPPTSTTTSTTIIPTTIMSSTEESNNCPGNYIPFRLLSFRWQEACNSSEDCFLLQVTANTTCFDDSYLSEIVIPLKGVSFDYVAPNGTIFNAYGSGNLTWPYMSLQFEVNVSSMDFDNPEAYYIVTATFGFSSSSGANKWDSSTISGSFPSTITLNAYAKFPMTLSPGKIEAHYLQPLNLTRLSNVGNFNVSDCANATGAEGACYFLSAIQEELSVCVALAVENETNGLQEEISICDDTVNLVTVNETTSLNHVQLQYPDGFVNISQLNSATYLELYQYLPDDTYKRCVSEGGCQLESFSISNKSYTFRMVEINDGDSPISSAEVLVQDFNVTTLGVSSDTVQVSWDSGSNDTFNVTISPGPEATYSGRMIDCIDATCDFFFIGLVDEWTNYNIVIQRQDEGLFTSEVVSTAGSPPEHIISDKHHLTTLSHYTEDGYTTTLTEACFELNEGAPIGPETARLLLIDSTGLAIQSIESVTEGANGSYCLDSVELSREFFSEDQSRLLVDFDCSGGNTSSTQMDIFLFAPDIQQVTNSSARVSWKNMNSAEFITFRAPGYDPQKEQEQKLECSYTGKQCYYYVKEDTEGNKNFSLLETSEKLNQTSTVQLQMIPIEKEIVITTPFSIRYDDTLRICFDATENVDRYELGVELLGELVSSNQNASLETFSGQTCAISQPVTLGAYANLWAVIVGYNKNGEILYAGETIYEDTFLSPNRFVLVVTSATATSATLSSSWFIVDDTAGFSGYKVELVDKSGETVDEPLTLPVDQTTYIFTLESEELYAVCISIIKPDGKSGDQTCSDIVTVEFSDDSPDPVPVVNSVEHFYTSDNHVKLSWERPEDASALLVTYDKIPSPQAARSPRSLNLDETPINPVFAPLKTKAREYFLQNSDAETSFLRKLEDQIPLQKAKALQNLNKQGKIEVLPVIDAKGFTLVPASRSSVDLPLSEGTWNVCVSAVKDHQSGKDTCVENEVEAKPTDRVDPPTGLAYEDGKLTWEAPDTDVREGLYSYYIECVRDSESLSAITDNTSFTLMELVEAGQWHVAVYAANMTTKRISVEQTITVVVDGIEVSYAQTGSRDVTLSWEEILGSPSSDFEDEIVMYNVKLEDVQEANATCSRASGCSVTFSGVEADENVDLDVTIQSLEDPHMTKDLTIYFLDIGTVPASQLSRTLHDDGSATVMWSCMDDVSFYNVTLVNQDDVVLLTDRQQMPCSYTFDDPTLTGLENDAVLIQACINADSAERCGDPQRMNLGVVAPPDIVTSNVLVIVLSSVAAGLLVILMVAGIVYKLRSDKAKLTAEDKKSGAGGSVNMMHMDSDGSQHSVDPPGGQNTISAQAITSIDAQPNGDSQIPAANSSSPPVGRQTPTVYRSNVPPPRSVMQAQPAIPVRQNPQGPRAPISSVNPNVRYEGPTQRSNPGYPGPQRFPQGGNPPQRFAAPRQAEPFRGPPGPSANPNNVRLSGQPRMNGPPGPSNFSVSPQRNVPQGARMQQRPTSSQPIEVPGRFSRQPIAARPTYPSPSRAPKASQPTGPPRMSVSPERYPPGQRLNQGPSSSPNRAQPPPRGIRPIPRVGRGGYTERTPSPPRTRPAANATRQFSPERSSWQPQPQLLPIQGREFQDTNRTRPNNYGGRAY